MRTVKEKPILELWNTEKSLFSMSLAEKMEAVNAGHLFGGFAWAPDSSKCVFVGEKKPPKAKGISEIIAPSEDPAEKQEKDLKDFFESSNLRDNFGESMDKTFEPELWLFHVEARKLEPIKNVDYEQYVPCHPCFVDPNSIVFHGILKAPFRLGQSFCMNRSHKIYYLNQFVVDPKAKVDPATLPRCLTPKIFAAFAPKLTNDGRIVFFARETPFFTHLGCLQLIAVKMEDFLKEEVPYQVLVDVVKENREGFNGIYTFSDLFKKAEIVEDAARSRQLFVGNTFFRGTMRIFAFDLKENKLVPLPHEDPNESRAIVCIDSKLGLVYKSASLGRFASFYFKSLDDFPNSKELLIFSVDPEKMSAVGKRFYTDLKEVVYEDIQLENGA